MVDRTQKLPNRKVGDDIVLPFVFRNGTAALPITAANVWIWSVEAEEFVVSRGAIELTSESTGMYRWTPEAEGDCRIEAHSVRADGLDDHSVTALIHIEAKLGEDLEFVAGDDSPAPVVLPYLHVSGIFDVLEDAPVGKLVFTSAAGVATTYAQRGDAEAEVVPVRASAVILAKISPTRARLAKMAELDGFTGLTPGALLYLGADGGFTHDPPGLGQLHQVVGEALTTTRVKIDIGEAFIVGRKVPALVAEFEIADGAAELDVSESNDFAAAGAVVAPTALTLLEGQDGDQGSVHLVQDDTGHAVSVVAAGRTTVYMEGAVPTTASKAIDVSFKFVTVAGVEELRIHSSAGA